MVISSYARPNAASTSSPGCAPTRPATEWWQVGEQKVDSTQDLLSLSIPKEGASATYHYKTSQQSAETVGDYVKSYALNGLVAGAVIGLMGAVAINVLGVAASILTAGFYGMFEGVGLLAPIAGGAVLGAGIGALSAREGYDDFQQFGNTVPGTLFSENGKVSFHPYDRLHEKVDLNAHAGAPVEQFSEGCKPWWQTSYEA